MKFEYDEEQDRGECVAYIDSDGDLVIVDGNSAIAICANGCHLNNEDWQPHLAIRKFYPGDKITITF